MMPVPKDVLCPACGHPVQVWVTPHQTAYRMPLPGKPYAGAGTTPCSTCNARVTVDPRTLRPRLEDKPAL
jgi:endogenous inhibitor of DNA gyrase (YacG/DUF329 family)